MPAGPYADLIVARPGYMNARGTNVDPDGQWVTLLAGDVNGDQVINIFDIAAVAGALNLAAPCGSALGPMDYNSDGSVTIVDLALVAQNFGRYGPTPIDP